MGRELFANSRPTTLDGAINSSVTSVDVIDASTWPLGNFSVVCDQEIMYCTSRSSNTLTVIRGTEGRSAAAHLNTAPIANAVTVGTLAGFRRNFLADLGLVPIDVSLSADDDEFDDENFSGWTAVNNGSNIPVITERNHRCSLALAGSGAGQLLQSYMKAKSPGAGDWVQAGFQLSTGFQYHNYGVIMADGATYNSGRQIVLQYFQEARAPFLREFTGYNSWNTGVNENFGSAERHTTYIVHLRLVVTATNTYQCFLSIDGVSWIPLNSAVSKGTVGAITHMGFFVSVWPGASRPAAFSVLYCRFSF